jgi:hypothetical protein
VNPSSEEFAAGRHWPEANKKNRKSWKTRLKNYFNHSIPAHGWFEPWRIGLDLLGASYEQRTAAHFDVSYRPTKVMLKNKRTDPKEFRRMVEREVEWFFRLLSLCPDLRLLLTFGPIVRADGLTESLAKFLRTRAPQNGFVVSQDGGLQHAETKRLFFIHEADAPGEKCLTCRVIKNLHTYRDKLRHRMGG